MERTRFKSLKFLLLRSILFFFRRCSRSAPEKFSEAEETNTSSVEGAGKWREYSDVGELKADLQKLIDNAVAFYKEDTEEREAANEMQDLLNKAMGKNN